MKQAPGFRNRLTYSNVMSTLYFFLLVSGGVAYAASHLGKNSVGTRQLKKNSVTGLKVKDKTLSGKDIDLATLGTVAREPAGITTALRTCAEANRRLPSEGELIAYGIQH